MLNVAIRADASVQLGTGHVIRCLTLADLLHKHLQANITFICSEIPAPLEEQIQSKGYQVLRIGEGPFMDEKADDELTRACAERSGLVWDWMVVDHYKLGRHWETSMRSHAKKMMAIDDLADRPHDCDLLLDQNYYFNLASRYEKLVPPHCKLCLGPQFALLRSQFYRHREAKEAGAARNVLIFYGGSDPTNETAKALKAIDRADFNGIYFDVVVGAANPNKHHIEVICSGQPNVRFHCQVEDMAALMHKADLTLGAGGTSHWERLYMRLPAIITTVADNQVETTTALADRNVIKYLGHYNETASAMIADAVQACFEQAGMLKQMRDAANKLLADHVRIITHPIIRAISEV